MIALIFLIKDTTFLTESERSNYSSLQIQVSTIYAVSEYNYLKIILEVFQECLSRPLKLFRQSD